MSILWLQFNANVGADSNAAGEYKYSKTNIDEVIKQLYILLFFLSFGFCQDYALSFDGEDDYVEIPNSQTFDLYDSFTIRTKIKIISYESSQGHAAIISKKPNNGWGGGFETVVHPPYDNGNGIGLNYTTSQGNTSFNYFNHENQVMTWYDVTTIYNGQSVDIYINGSLKASNPSSGNLGINDIPVRLGRRAQSGYYTHYYNGLIDEITIWNAALDIEEVGLEIDSLTIDEGLVAHWDFNTGSGDILYDHSGNGNHGVIYGATWIENIDGCSDTYAENYNPDVNFNDGSCIYPDNGDYSLSFDGLDDWVEINKPLINPHEFSIIFEIKTGVDNKQLFWNGKNINSSSHLDNAFNFDLNTPNNFYTGFFSANNDESLWSYLSLTDEIEHNVIITFDNGVVKHFVDGLLTASDNYNFNSINVDNSNFTAIGRGIHTSGARYYDGVINEILIINKSLDESELSDPLSNLNYSIDVSAHYKFNAGEGTILHDHSGNGNHGTINGATWVCSDMDLCGVCKGDNSTCTIISDIDGNEYGSVEIGRQTWLRQNLKVNHYNNGDQISTDFSDSEWVNLSSGAYGVYNDEHSNAEVYGNLYNWFAVDDDRGICPAGYHLPNDSEWMELEVWIGLDIGELDSFGWRGENQGNNLKVNGTQYWFDANGNNSTQFSARGGGMISNANGSSNNLLEKSFFWSSSEYDNYYGITRELKSSDGKIRRSWDGKNLGYSVRCLSDESISNTILVPENFTTIQEAIDFSVDGDTILVSAGTYNENINFNGKNIALIGEDRETTIIDGGGSGRVVEMYECQDPASILELTNFTLENGNHSGGGGIYLYYSNPNLKNLIIQNNNASDDGGGIHSHGATPILENLIIQNNSASVNGGGIYIENTTEQYIGYNYSIPISNCSILNNTSEQGGGIYINNGGSNIFNSGIFNNLATSGGGGLKAQNSEIIISNSHFNNNSSYRGGGILSDGGTMSIYHSLLEENFAEVGETALSFYGGFQNLINCTIANNNGPEQTAIHSERNELNIKNSIIYGNSGNNHIAIGGTGGSELHVSYSLIEGGQESIVSGTGFIYWLEGNILENPQFNDDFTLQSSSPCIDSGDPNSPLDPDGTRADMGAYYYHQDPTAYGCTDDSACNYNPDVTDDDGSCLFFDCTGECGGSIVLDACGECGGNNIACYLDGFGCSLSDECESDFCDVCGECGYTNIGTGDVNLDDNTNVGDIIFLIDRIVNEVQFNECQIIVSDVYSDNSINIFDLIVIVDIILGEGLARTNITVPTSVEFIQSISRLSYQSDVNGLIGIELILGHDDACNFDVTKDAFITDYNTVGNITKMLIIIENGHELFTSTEEFQILEYIVGTVNGEVDAILSIIPDEYSLGQAYPNPFNPATTISFTVPIQSDVILTIYNLKGSEVKSLVNGNMEAGYHSVVWNADPSISSGMYFAKIVAGNYTHTQKLMLLK